MIDVWPLNLSDESEQEGSLSEWAEHLASDCPSPAF